MMDQNEFLLQIVGKLQSARIPYMITGSCAAGFYGEPRATFDTDLVIDPTIQQIRRFAEDFDESQYVSLDAAVGAVTAKSMFNVIDTQSGWKADLIIRKDRPFSTEEFNRRRKIKFQGCELFVVSPEDAILSKLEWSRTSQSQRQLRDAASIALLQWDDLDNGYLRSWAQQLSVERELDEILKQVGQLRG